MSASNWLTRDPGVIGATFMSLGGILNKSSG
jgi:hypothetical protein